MENQDANQPNSSSSLDNLRLISYCPLCNTHYNPSEAKILDEKDGAHLIHIACKNCHSSIVAVVITGGIGISSVGLITDLTSKDVMHFKNEPAVNEDDVIQAYQLVQDDNFISFLD